MADVRSEIRYRGDESVDELQEDVDDVIEAAEDLRNVNKGRSGSITRTGINAAKKLAESVGDQAKGIFGERGLKLRGVVGASVGLLSFDKGVELIKRIIQGADVRNAVLQMTREIIPPLFRDHLPALFDEFSRRERLDDESRRQAMEFNRDLALRVKDTETVRRAGQKLWLDEYNRRTDNTRDREAIQGRRF